MGLMSLASRHELIWLLTVDTLKKQFTGSVLGVWWVLLRPIWLVGLYGFVFVMVFKPVSGPSFSTMDYLLLLLTGMGPWLLLAEPLASASGSIAANTPLVTRVVFPTEVLPVCRALGSTISGCATLVLALGLLACQGRIGMWSAAVPMVVLVQLLFVMGLAWGLATVCVSIPDLAQGLPFLLNGWLFLSPVVYTKSMVPSDWLWVSELNPMTHTIAIYRSLLLSNSPPDAFPLIALSVCAIVSFFGGYSLFMKRRMFLADLV